MDKYKGLFITIEGCDGSGKSTQTKLVIDKLEKLGFKVFHSREPGGTSVSEKIRKLLLDPENKIFPVTELLLYEAARYQNTFEKIIPELKKGTIIICERYIDSSIVYQGYGRKLPILMVQKLNEIATGGLLPDITFVFNMNVKKGLIRARALSKSDNKIVGGDRLERENLSFHKRINSGYKKLSVLYPDRIKIISVDNKSIQKNFEHIMKIILETIRKKNV